MDSCVTHPLVDEAEGGVPAAALTRKASGAYFTPEVVAATLVRWAVRRRDDRLLDPSCGDGTFLAAHARSIGVEVDAASGRLARQRAPLGEVHIGDFFAWAERTGELFDCAAGNPPFIRYQRFTGETRERALRVCRGLGATFSGLTSSWAPFLVATAALLRPGGRMAFVIPAEAGHAPYAVPFLEYLVGHFAIVHVVAIREKLYPDLSEDCWLLFADGFGGRASEIRFSAFDRFVPSDEPPQSFESVDLDEWRQAWRHRLRPYLMPPSARETYRSVVASTEARRLGEIASVGIGYVTGANDFFHLRPSQARRLRIPGRFLSPSVRNGRVLSGSILSAADIARWRADDEPFLLLRLPKEGDLPAAVEAYLDTEAGRLARMAYKCRTRTPWHSVPDVQVPDYLLSYMSGERPSLVRNDVGCTATNSVHCLRLRHPASGQALDAWGSPFVDLSCELEGHPLGGGMLKLEPREAARLVLPAPDQIQERDEAVCREAVALLRRWRHRAV